MATGALAAAGWLYLDRAARRALALPEGSRPNILLISIDTLRADHLGAYGGKVATPVLDRLAREGVVFERAVSHVPITLPSHASLLTGMYPIAHGVRDNGAFRLEDSYQTLAESFRAGGYRTAAFVGSFALDSRFGLGQGFELYDDFYGDTSEFNDFAISERPADAVLEPAVAWLEQQSGKPWFAFIHLYDPHAPYAPPPPFRETYRSNPYVGEVAYVDDALGRFLARLREKGRLKDTLLLLTADHGEGLGEHGEKTHGMFAYEATLRVPLILNWPGALPAGMRVPQRVRLIDIAPTLAEMAGLRQEPGYQGESLLPLLRHGANGASRESYFEALAFNLNRNWAPLSGIYSDRFKYIDLPLPELYDLEKDPVEARNLYQTSPGIARQMAAALARHVEAHSTAESREIQTARVDEETEARLRTLGYVISASPVRKRTEYSPDDDPKRLVLLSDMLDEGVAAHLAGRPAEAIRIFREILRRRPTFTNVYANLAYVLRESGRLDEAIDVLEQAMKRALRTRTMLGRLGLYLQEGGRLKESVAILEFALREDPGHAEAYNYLAVSYARLGRIDAALSTLDKLLDLDSSYASAYCNQGSVYLGARRHSDAERSFQRALSLDPRLAAAWNGLGVVYAGTGREGEAIAAWRKSVELDPRQYDTLYNLGTLLTKLNRFQEAVSYLDQFIRTAPPDRYGADLPRVKRLLAALRGRA